MTAGADTAAGAAAAPPTAAAGVTVVGLSHRTCPVALRERAALDDAAAARVLRRLRDAGIDEAAVLSTCNRVELYGAGCGSRSAAVMLDALCAETGLPQRALDDAVSVRRDADAVRHLFGVAAGLDSAVLGEPEILHQVRGAATLAATHGALGPRLREAFRHAVATGGRVRRETAIARGALTTASVTVELAERALLDLHGRRALLVGAGATARSVGRALRRRGVAEVLVANRTAANGRRLAAELGGRDVALAALASVLAAADLVVCCTRAPGPVVRRADLARAAAGRGDRPLVCVDLAVPRDIEPEAASVSGVVLLDIDDLRLVTDANRAGRALAARRAEAMVDDAVARLLARPLRAPLRAAA